LSSTQHISPENLTLYAVQGLPPSEMAAVQGHLDTCAACRSELASTLTGVSLIGIGAEQQPLPDGARQRFMARIEETPQQAKTVTPSVPPLAISAQREPRRGLGWFGWMTALAALAVAIYLGYHSFVLQKQIDADRAQITQLTAQAVRAQQLQGLMDALTSPEAKQVTLTETRHPAQPVGHATYLKKNGTLIFVASNLRPVSQDKTYELWLIPANGTAPIPAGLFRPDSSGSASVILPTLPQGVEAKAFGVTIEEASGSATPTLPIVMSGQ
jgi:hypothetical protein